MFPPRSVQFSTHLKVFYLHFHHQKLRMGLVITSTRVLYSLPIWWGTRHTDHTQDLIPTLLGGTRVRDPSNHPDKDVNYVIMDIKLTVVRPLTRLLYPMCCEWERAEWCTLKFWLINDCHLPSWSRQIVMELSPSSDGFHGLWFPKENRIRYQSKCLLTQ